MASGGCMNQIKIYLSFYDACGYQSRLQQLETGSITSPICHFLSDEDTDGPLFVTEHSDELHSHACLSMFSPEFEPLILSLTMTRRCVCKYCHTLRIQRHHRGHLGSSPWKEPKYLQYPRTGSCEMFQQTTRVCRSITARRSDTLKGWSLVC